MQIIGRRQSRDLAAANTNSESFDISRWESTAKSSVTLYASHHRAFYTSDGLVLSSKILDALIVQAFYYPQLYDTVNVLCAGYTHDLTSDECRRRDLDLEQSRLGQPVAPHQSISFIHTKRTTISCGIIIIRLSDTICWMDVWQYRQ